MLKFAITGPESTGKSSLAEELARHYKTVFVPEYARKYINSLSKPYTENDLLRIARGQIQAESNLEKQANGILFSDTEMLIMKIWSNHRYGRCHPFILDALHKQNHNLYLLCNIDLPWEYDPQREHPDLREFFFNWYKDELDRLGFKYVIINGFGHARLQNAIMAVDGMLRGTTP
ncbi:MAG TPA: ATP-binding protein [Bacteroidales bacterium]|nr:ATP-binding protein [Bacteroidales bacterium]